MNTPWGKSDSRVAIERGVSWVGTPSHGGLAITAGRAVKTLTGRAVTIAMIAVYGTEWVNLPNSSYLFFEEDCLYAIPFYEHPEWYRALEASTAVSMADNGYAEDSLKHIANSRRADDDVRDEMSIVIRRWYPEYFSRF